MNNQDREEEALRLARDLRRQVSDLRDQAKAVGQAIASQPATGEVAAAPASFEDEAAPESDRQDEA